MPRVAKKVVKMVINVPVDVYQRLSVQGYNCNKGVEDLVMEYITESTKHLVRLPLMENLLPGAPGAPIVAVAAPPAPPAPAAEERPHKGKR